MSRSHRSFLLLAMILALAPACDFGDGPGSRHRRTWSRIQHPLPGLPRFQRLGAIPVPGGIVNGSDGNLMVRRIDLSIDTRLGNREVAATYNSATREWIWSFQMRYDGIVFTGPRGGLFVRTAGWGVPIHADDWIWHDPNKIRSAGGLLHEFGEDGRLETIRWLSDPYPRLEYLAEEIAGEARTTEMRQCRAAGLCETVYTVEYDAAGRVTALQDRAGRRAELAWDAEGQLVQARDPLDLARGWPGFRYEYSAPALLHALTNSEGERIRYRIDEKLGRVKVVARDGDFGRHRFIFGKYHYVTPASDPDWWLVHLAPDDERTTYQFDDLRRLRRRIQSNQDLTTWDWSGFEVARLEQPDGSATEWERVSDHEILRREPGGNEVRILLPTDGGENRAEPSRRATLRVEDSLGPVEERHYEDHRLVWIENGAGERTTLEYDAENQIARVTRPSGIATVFDDYGEHGHAARVTFAGETEIRTFDAVGNLLRSDGLALRDFRPAGEVERRYDEDRNVIEIVTADAPVTGPAALHTLRLERGSDGRTTRIERPFGGDHEMVYDAAGRLIERRERVDGAWQPTVFTRDVRNRVTATMLPNGMRQEIEYDAIGRIRTLRSLRDGAVEEEATITYQGGRVQTVADAGAEGPEVYAWDSDGRLASVRFPGGELLELAWDARSRRTAETYSIAGGTALRSLAFEYDAAGRSTIVRDDGERVVERSYANGRLDQVQYGNGLVRQHAYDPVSGLPSATLLEHPVQGLVSATTITVQAAPAPNGAEVTLVTAVGPETSQEQYRLGPLGSGGPRVVSWSDGAASNPAGYDALGNLTGSSAGDHVFNAEANRLLRIDAPDGSLRMDYVHDAAGFVSARGGEGIAWTAHGFVAGVGDRAEFEWDAFGRPSRRRIEAEERRFLFGGRVETDADGTPLRIDLDAVVLELAASGRRYRHTDLRGNVQLVSDDTGQIVARYRYDAYGIAEQIGEDDASSTFARGRRLGDLVVLGPRLHDPLAGRFLAPDPLFQDLSQHTYANGNPVWFWDRNGLHAETTNSVDVAVDIAALKAEASAGRAFQSEARALMVVGVLLAIWNPVVGGSVITLAVGAYLAGRHQTVTAQRKATAIMHLARTANAQQPPSASTSPTGPSAPPQPCTAGCGGPRGSNPGGGNSSSPSRSTFPTGYWRGFGW